MLGSQVAVLPDAARLGLDAGDELARARGPTLAPLEAEQQRFRRDAAFLRHLHVDDSHVAQAEPGRAPVGEPRRSEREVDPVALRPHPYEFFLYYDA